MSMNPRTLRPSSTFSPRSISGLALWLDASSDTLFTTDAGPVVAVASPLDIAGCALWLDASDPASITASSGNVTAWTDKSASALSFTAAGTPVTGSATLNGRNVIRFDNVADLLSATSATRLGITSSYTVFTVARYTTVQTSMLMSIGRSVSPNTNGLTLYYNAGLRTIEKRDAAWGTDMVVSGSLATANAALLATGTRSGTDQRIMRDGMLAGSTAGSTGNIAWGDTTVLIGNTFEGTFLGDIAEIIVYPTALTTADRASVEAYLAAKWGISGVHRSAAQEIAAVASPLEIAGLTEWFDATDTSGTVTTVAGDKISSWASKVAGGRTLTQGNDTLRPVMTDNIQNGLRMAKFDGVDDFIRTATPETFADKTVFIVARPTNVTADQAVWGASKQNITLYGYYYSAGFRVNSAAVTVRPETGGASARRIAASANEAVITSLQFKTSELLAGNFNSTAPYKNGTLFDTNDSVVLADYAIGSTMGANDSRPAAGVLSNFYSGYVGEVLIYDAYLSAVDRARVEKYLQQKWATPTVPDPTPPVGYWGDRSGNGRHAVQSLAGSRPLVGSVNSRRALTFDGTDDCLTASIATASLCSTDGGVAFYVAVPNSDSAWAAFTNSGPVGHIDRFSDGASYHGNFRNTRFSGINAGAYTTTGAQLIVSRTSAATGLHTVRKDGATIHSGAEDIAGYRGLIATASLSVGSSVTSLGPPVTRSHFLAGSVPEVLCYSSPLTDVQVRRIETYLATRWGITLAPQVSNADAQDWINRVYANGGSVSSATAGAVNSLCDSLDSSGVRPLMYRMGIFAGSNLNAALVPLYRGPSLGGTQYGNATDTNQGGLFVSGNYSESGGLVGDGSTKYLKTGLASNQLAGGLTGHAAIWRGAGTVATTRIAIGGSDNDVDDFEIQERSASTHGAWGKTTFVGSTPANVAGLKMINRSSSTRVDLYSNGSSIANSTAPVVVAPHANEFYVFGGNRNGTLTLPVALPVFAYSLGVSMDATQATAYYNALSAFQTSLSRT